jgi:hypothetical protein
MLKSRKFALTIFGTLLATFMGLISAEIPAIAGVYSTFIGGLIGVLGLYFGSNIGQKWITKDTPTITPEE